MTINARPRIGVIGAGVMGSYHARVVAQSERCELVAVIDPNNAVGPRLADRYNVPWLPSAEQFSNIDAVVLAAPTEYHSELVLQALNERVPVLVEKPASASLADTERMVQLSAQYDVPLMCGFVERFNPAVLTVQSLVQEPAHVTAVRHSPYANRIRTGVAWDLLIHDVDACLRLINQEPIDVRAGVGAFHPASADHGEDVAEAVLTFGSGAVASVSASRICQRKVRSITVAELERTIELDLMRRDVTIYRHVSHDSPANNGLGYRQQTIMEIPELVSSREPLAAQLDRFLDLVSGAVDLKEERDSILPPHRVIDQVLSATVK